MIHRAWIGAHAGVTQKRQCVLAGVSRKTVVYWRRSGKRVNASEPFSK